MPQDDRGLVERSRTGDMAAFEALIRQYESRVCRTLYLLLPNQDDVEDVAQEVFIRVFRSLNSFRGDCEFSTWLHRVTLNTLRNWTRSRRPTTSLDAMPMDRQQWQADPAPDEVLIRRQEADDLRKALGGLPEHYREALVLRHFHQLSYEEIAQVQQVPLGTVRSRIAKGRQILLERLKSTGVITESERTAAK